MRRRRQRHDDRRDERNDEHGQGGPARRNVPTVVPVPDLPREVSLYRDRQSETNVEASFVVNLPRSPEARLAALSFAEKMGLGKARILSMEAVDAERTRVTLAGLSETSLSLDDVRAVTAESTRYDFDAINRLLMNRFERPIVVLGACVGTESQSIALDTIFNMRGYLGDFGLERYGALRAINIREVADAQTVARAVVETRADAVLLSRGGVPPEELPGELKRLLQTVRGADGVAPHLITMCHGPRITQASAAELGFDAGFGPGTLPNQVAGFITTEIIKRLG